MKTKYIYLLSLSILSFYQCKKQAAPFKASGIFEAKEIIISAEAGGKIEELNIEEGSALEAGQLIGKINCSQQELSSIQAQESLKSIDQKLADAGANIKVMEQQKALQENQVKIAEDQLATLVREENRLKKLVDAQAIPTKQLDDVQSQKLIMEKSLKSARHQITIIEEQIKAARANTVTQNKAILSEKSPMNARLNQLKDLEQKCTINNPIKGVVLTQYAYQYEMATPGKALYKIANLDTLILKAYVTGDQLPQIKLQQNVDIHTKQGDQSKNYTGTILWISDKSEFTPKSIMTVDERANLVYPIKIKVPNDGSLKLGLFAEINW